MQVKDVMTKDVALADPEMTLVEVARKMRDRDIGAMPVGENDRLVGVITDRDISVRAVAEGKNVGKTRVRDAMSKHILYVFDDEQIEEAAKSMAEQQVRRFPVLNRQKRLVGIVSLGDISLECPQEKAVAGALRGVSEHTHHEAQRWKE